MKKHEKCTYETSITVTSFEDNSFLTSEALYMGNPWVNIIVVLSTI
jgi:hypothetical protein